MPLRALICCKMATCAGKSGPKRPLKHDFPRKIPAIEPRIVRQVIVRLGEGYMRNYFSWTIASVISLAGIGAASAADMAVKARPAPVVLPYNWTGCYIGGNVGGKWANSTNDVFVPGTIVAPDVTHSFGRDNASTVIGGGQVGCNWQTGSMGIRHRRRRPGATLEFDAYHRRWRNSAVRPRRHFRSSERLASFGARPRRLCMGPHRCST